MKIKGFIFDLDGVITDTAKYHFKAWKACAKTVGIDLPDAFEEDLKGIGRANSLKRILAFGKVEVDTQKFEELLKWKNDLYVSFLDELTTNSILPGIKAFLDELKAKGFKLAIASASKNASTILHKLKITDYFDYICDPATLKHGKPDPEIFLNCAQGLGFAPEECIGLEDAPAGIEAIKAANMFAIGIGQELTAADLILTSTKELTFMKVQPFLE